MDSAASTRTVWRSRLLDALFIGLALGAIKRTFRDSQLNSEDFHVYWKAAYVWLQGQNPYAYTPADQGFVFKYPPWILPIFTPLGFMGFETAKIAWYLVELACVAYAIVWCIRQGVPRRIAAFVACLFWWMFHAHFSAGQFTIILLVVALWAHGGAQAGRADGRMVTARGRPSVWAPGGGLRETILAFILSAKVFSLYTLTGIWRRYLKPLPWLAGIGLFVLMHAIVLAVNAKLGGATSLARIYRDFMDAASSGGAELGAIIVRGQGNHGFTALVLRTLDVDSLSFASDMIASAALFIPLAYFWSKQSRVLNESEKWVGWIALALIVHPLAWHHSYVLAYPLCALSLARAASSGRRKLIGLSILGACCIGIFIPQVLGKTLVKPIELAGIKSWGVILSAVAMVLAAKHDRARRPAPGAPGKAAA